MARLDLPHAELLARLHYNPETGIFTWLKYFAAKRVGKQAGLIHPESGYVTIPIKPWGSFRANRLAWFYMTGREFYIPQILPA
jgi:hypothetical protein